MPVRSVLSLVLAMVLASASAEAATWHVATNGIDSGACGSEADPCRSITQAMANASAGDTVLVGPGRYGELTDGQSEGLPGGAISGEEMPAAGYAAQGRILIDKPVRIESTHGAAATFLADNGVFEFAVRIVAGGAVLGGPDKGFTVHGTVRVEATSGISVIGLTIVDGHLWVSGANHTIDRNTMLPRNDGGPGVTVEGSGHAIRNNVIDTGRLYVAGSDITIANNSMIGSPVYLEQSSSNTEITRNTILASPFAGIVVGLGATATIHQNNIFGNWPQVDPPEGNCGVLNQSGAVVDATDNFWGASSGPGPEPADQVCDEPGSTTLVGPFAIGPFAIGVPGSGSGPNANPACSAALAVPSVLWPANNQFVRTWIIGVGDPDGDPTTISISRATQDEPTRGLTGADVGPDATLFGSSADLRAQRNPRGSGRVYRVEFSAADGRGGSCTGAVTVGVPNNQRPGGVIVDDGQVFDSTEP